jgi:hypothetical protein
MHSLCFQWEPEDLMEVRRNAVPGQHQQQDMLQSPTAALEAHARPRDMTKGAQERFSHNNDMS